MNIALIGSGGREHALCQKIIDSNKAKKVYCIPGNAGTAQISENININILDFKKILKFVKQRKINLVIVGPEEPLVKGIVDFLSKNKIKVFGPNKFASQLEGSKAFMKNLCEKNNIPTAKFKICKNKNDVFNFLKKSKLPLVVKADGLAAGKGVTICNSKKKVLKFSEEIFEGKFQSSKKLVLEEFIKGEEASYFIIVDKNNFQFFGSAQDHKRVKENDKGPNTGGMGAFSPAKIINKKIEKKVIKKIINPTLHALKKKNNPYKGILYVGLMIKNGEPYLIEYNVRMGDPECQVILPRLKTDIIQLFINTINNNLKKTKIKWLKEKCMAIVLCSKGYPGKYKKNIVIKNLKKIKFSRKNLLFHAGTILNGGKIYSNGGRVLNIVSLGNNFLKIRKTIIRNIRKINWKSGFYRKDIGWKVIKKNANN